MKDVNIREIKAKSILRKHKKIDSWFLSAYGMNLYRGCTHNCVYCDGRAEKYNVEGEFGKDVAVKVNAVEVLQRELDPRRKRTPLKPSYMMIGGGVGDSYQSVEKTYQLTRKTLELMAHYDFPVHVLTKSTLVKRDVDILKQINDRRRALVSMSFSSVDDQISARFEPGVPPPSERLETLAFLKKQGLACGMFLLPVIPFITDTPEVIENSIRKASEIGLDFVIFGGMTLKTGRQQDYFYRTLKKRYPELQASYHTIYHGDKWGNASEEYYASIHSTFNHIASQYKMPKRIPPKLFTDILDENDRVIVILEHLDYLLKLKGKSSPYRFAAYAISQLDKPLSTMKEDLQTLKGVGPTTERIIREILDTGSCSTYYEKLLTG
jgi:DNA repair photolyase